MDALAIWVGVLASLSPAGEATDERPTRQGVSIGIFALVKGLASGERHTEQSAVLPNSERDGDRAGGGLAR